MGKQNNNWMIGGATWLRNVTSGNEYGEEIGPMITPKGSINFFRILECFLKSNI